MNELHEKLKKLKDYFRKLGSVSIAFSGGVDSTFMLRIASESLPQNKVIAFTGASASFPKREMDLAKKFCLENNIRHIIFDSDELNIEEFRHNPKNRCYICKKQLFTKIKELSIKNNIEFVCEGSNMDDLGDYRPGLKAIEELGIKSPLMVSNLNKQEIRALSKEMNLKTWDKPSFACLASRFVYGELINEEKLKKIDMAEEFLLHLGFTQVRVRLHKDIARIEIFPEEFTKIIQKDIREKINKTFKEYGFLYITLDLFGYKTGSMNT